MNIFMKNIEPVTLWINCPCSTTRFEGVFSNINKTFDQFVTSQVVRLQVDQWSYYGITLFMHRCDIQPFKVGGWGEGISDGRTD